MLAEITPEDSILASNTSSYSITRIQDLIPSRSPNVIGMHFMNPVPVMKLLEVVVGRQTSPETVERAQEIGKMLNKTCIVSKDSPGFIANRILLPYLNEACRALDQNMGSIEDID
mmetsp:Transcript_37840/g.27859  ORF Transcript_37840/g.27859 Transcript_37840/m.27859 type:complete len:115 (+) Transcript_37840:104-448(+)